MMKVMCVAAHLTILGSSRGSCRTGGSKWKSFHASGSWHFIDQGETLFWIHGPELLFDLAEQRLRGILPRESAGVGNAALEI